MNIVLTISGFLVAFLVNLFFPQVAENVRIKEYVFGGFTVDDNLAYRLVLLAIIAYYAVYTVVLLVRKPNASRVAKFYAGAKFRFAVGLALVAFRDKRAEDDDARSHAVYFLREPQVHRGRSSEKRDGVSLGVLALVKDHR